MQFRRTNLTSVIDANLTTLIGKIKSQTDIDYQNSRCTSVRYQDVMLFPANFAVLDNFSNNEFSVDMTKIKKTKEILYSRYESYAIPLKSYAFLSQ